MTSSYCGNPRCTIQLCTALSSHSNSDNKGYAEVGEVTAMLICASKHKLVEVVIT